MLFRSAIPPEKATAKVYHRYQQRIAEANAMDFDDMLVNAERLLREHPEVLEFYQDRFRYIWWTSIRTRARRNTR